MPPIAPDGRPPPSVFASVTMSGTTPKCSTAPPAATVSPVFTSSKIRTIPWRSVSSRTASRYPGSGSTTPRFIIAASMITQAGRRPSAASRSIRRSIAAASLNGTTTVMSTTACGIPAPYASESRSSRCPKRPYSTPIETITVSWWPWYEPKIFSTVSRPVWARAIRIASIVASEPEFVYRHFGSRNRRASSSATTMPSSVAAAKCVPSAARSRTAAVIAGCAWPCVIEPKPLWKSM